MHAKQLKGLRYRTHIVTELWDEPGSEDRWLVIAAEIGAEKALAKPRNLLAVARTTRALLDAKPYEDRLQWITGGAQIHMTWTDEAEYKELTGMSFGAYTLSDADVGYEMQQGEMSPQN